MANRLKNTPALFFPLGLSLPLSLFFSNYLFVIGLIVLILKSPKRKQPRWLALFVLIIPALIPVFSILFHNETLELRSVEVKIPFIVVGLIVAFTRLSDSVLSKFKIGFIIGTFIGGCSVFIEHSSLFDFLINHMFFELTYNSLYIVIALIYLWFTDIAIIKGIKLIMTFIFLIILVNIGDTFFITTGSLVTFAAIIVKGTSFQSKLAIGFLVLLFTMFIYKGAEIQQHLPNKYETKELSGVDKLAQWQCVLEIMQNKELFGVGYSSKDGLLTTCYHEHAMFQAEVNELNSHNEYLNSFLTLGYIGVLGMLIFFFKVLFVAYDTKQVAQFLIIALIALFSISENVFTRQKGVMITTITCLLIFSSKQKKIDGETKHVLPTR